MSADFRQGLIVGALLTAIAFAAFVGCSSAQTWLVVNGLAKHLDGGEHCNSITTGLGVERAAGPWRTSAGFYRNSNCEWSTYAAEAWCGLRIGIACAGAIAGVVTGYRRSGVLPAGGAVLALERERVGANIVFIPPLRDSGNVLWLQAKVRW